METTGALHREVSHNPGWEREYQALVEGEDERDGGRIWQEHKL